MMIKKNKVQIILSSVVTILPMVAGLFMWNILPESMATHWGMSGEADGFSSKAFTVFAMPLMMLVIQWICVLATARDPRNKEQSGKVVGMVLWIIPLVSLIMNGMVYAVALGNTAGVDVWVRVLLGLMFVILGNYMPKCKRNYTIGVKTGWALANEENWNKTHRFTGKLWVVGGVIILATIFIPLEKYMWVFLEMILMLSFIPIIYSYLYHRKQVKEGTAGKEQVASDPEQAARMKKMSILSLIPVIPILIFVGVALFTGNINYRFEDDSFTIHSAYWEDMTVEYGEITSLEYRKQDTPGTRTFGFGSLKLLMGSFENAEFGGYTRYTYVDCDACIVLKSEDKVLVINGEDEAQTQELYMELENLLADTVLTEGF